MIKFGGAFSDNYTLHFTHFIAKCTCALLKPLVSKLDLKLANCCFMLSTHIHIQTDRHTDTLNNLTHIKIAKKENAMAA